MGYAINGLIKAEQLDFLTFLTRSISPKLTLLCPLRKAKEPSVVPPSPATEVNITPYNPRLLEIVEEAN